MIAILLASLLCSSTLAQSAPSLVAISDADRADLSAEDWSSIRAAYDAERHAAVAVDGGFRARNFAQQLTAHFDERGFTTVPDAAGWTWGLELSSYGFAAHERAVSTVRRTSVDGSRVTYDWDATLQEWYVNHAHGIEHGFTVHERPEPASGPLCLTLAIRGNLAPITSDDGRAVRFVNADGATVLTYAGLVAFDADGCTLEARMLCDANGLRIAVDERGARYPLTIDPTVQQAYLKASNTDAGDLFGSSVAIHGDTVVVGAVGEDSHTTGVNGDQNSNLSDSAGAAYVFVRSGTTWSQQAYLKASTSDIGGLDAFGKSVAIHGDTIVVGADGEDSAATGVNGNQNDNNAEESGAVYVFVRSGTTWSQQAYLKASNTDEFDRFGAAVSIFGDTIVVGANGEASNATGVNGNQSDDSIVQAGAAYVFVRSGTTWSQQAYLKASNTQLMDFFADSVSISGDTIIVGAQFEDSNATGIGGNQADNSASNAGAAYVFFRSGTSWSQQAYLKASNTQPSDTFGASVAISAETIVVGATGEDSNATVVNGDQSNNTAGQAGAAYVFVRSGTSWSQQAYLKAPNAGASDSFGRPVAISGDAIVVAALSEDSNATGVNGNGSNNSATDSGAAYVFKRLGTSWSQQAYLKASNTAAGDWFGHWVSIAGNTVIVGADFEDSSATGVNGDQSNNGDTTAGAAYVFVLDPSVAYCFGDGVDPVVTAQCPCANLGAAGHGCANSFSSLGGLLTASGTTSPNTIEFTVSTIPNNTLTVGFRTTGNATPQGVVFGDGVRCQSGTLIRFGARNSGTLGDPANTWSSTAATVASGLTRYYQVQFRNSAPAFCPPATFNITNGAILVW